MGDVIARTAVVAGLIVIFAGCVLLVALAAYGVLKTWSKISAFAKNMKEYLYNRRDFMEYKQDFDSWEERKRWRVERCKRCEYRLRYMEEEHGD